MRAFTPPPEAEWCPNCQRERVACSHQDKTRVVTDGGRALEREQAVEHVKDAHPHLLGLASAAASGDADAVKRHADALRDALDAVEAAVIRGDA